MLLTHPPRWMVVLLLRFDYNLLLRYDDGLEYFLVLLLLLEALVMAKQPMQALVEHHLVVICSNNTLASNAPIHLVMPTQQWHRLPTDIPC